MLQPSHESETTGNAPDQSISPWQNAAVFAARAHRGQTTPDSTDPYFSHPARVALLVSSVFGVSDPDVLATSLLHDVLEKTSVEAGEIEKRFGGQVREWVEWLSKNRKKELGGYWERLQHAPWQARLIKLADALDHLNGPAQFQTDRIKAARKALKLAYSDEPEILRAAAYLSREIDRLERVTAS